jgi:hypothetical protein
MLSGSNSAVECDLAKVEVAGSNPVSRSNLKKLLFLPVFAASFSSSSLKRSLKPKSIVSSPPNTPFRAMPIEKTSKKLEGEVA